MSKHKAANQQGLQGGASAPDVQDAVPQEQGTPLPPEILSMIDNLPPEVLEQLLAVVEAEMQEGAGPEQGGMPQEDPNAMVGKTAAYREGFYSYAGELGFNQVEADKLYKRALDLMGESAVTEQTLVEKQAHFIGFMERASELELTEKQAYDLYAFGFHN